MTLSIASILTPTITAPYIGTGITALLPTLL
jgi:hypothetical protein